MKRKAFLTVVVATALFLSGAGTGALLFHWTGGEAPWNGGEGGDRPAAGETTPRGADGGGEEEDHRDRGPVYALSRLLHEELDLTEEQERRVEAILERRRERAEQLFQEMRERFRAELAATVEELKGPLTAEQAAEFQRLIDEMRERWRKGDEERESRDAPSG